ncbi:MAG: DinB family protein [Ginsengibacter sp.]
MESNNEISALIKRVTKQLNDFYDGNNWVTDNLEKKIFSLTSVIALKNAEGHSHSIAGLLTHLTSWRNFVVQKLTGNSEYDVVDNSSDWPSPADWDAARSEFIECHKKLLIAIDNFPIGQWHATVPLRSYSFLYLINGIVEHDYYHFGQMGSVLAGIKTMVSKTEYLKNQ